MADSAFYWRLLKRLDQNLEGYLAVGLMMIYTLLLIWVITTRTLLGSQQAGVLPLVLGLFTWMVWLSLPYATRQKGHLRFTLLRVQMPRSVNYALFVLEWIMWIVLAVVVVREAIPILETRITSGSTVPGFDIPEFLFYASIPVGFTLTLARVLQQAITTTHEFYLGNEVKIDSNMQAE